MRPGVRALVVLLLIAATAAVFSPVWRNGFINFDDPDYVKSNPMVQSGLNGSSVRWAFTSYHSSNWHPVTWMSHMLDCQLFGLHAGAHHLVSLGFHIANTILLLFLLARLTRTFWRSALVAALFALHPLHVESVAWIAERKDVLSTFFFVLTVWWYAEYCGSHGASRMRRKISYGLALLSFGLGLMSKPMLVTVPCVLLLLDFWPLGRLKLNPSGLPVQGLGRVLVEKLPFFALSVASSAITFMVQRASGAVVSLSHASFETRLGNALVSYARYLARTFWPADLAVFYPFVQGGWSPIQIIAATALVLGLTALVVWMTRRAPWGFVGWFWFIGTLVPVIGFVQVGRQSIADRYTYLPHIGLFIATVWTAGWVVGRMKAPRAIGALASVLVLAAAGWLSWKQVRLWRDTETLFAHARSVTQNNFVAHGVLANCYVEQNKLAEALVEAQEALRIAPGFPEAHQTLGNIYVRQGKYDEGIASYNEAIRCDPGFGELYASLGDVLLKQRRFSEAETACREAVRLAPLALSAWFTLASSLHQQGKLEDAAACYRHLLDLNPHLYSAHRFLGNALLGLDKVDDAVSEYRAALKIRPTDSDTLTSLGVVLLDRGQVEDAAAQFNAALQHQPTNFFASYQLAQISQSQKRLPDAVSFYRRALQTQPDWPEALNNLAWLLAASSDPKLRNGPEAVKLAEKACVLTENKQPLLLGTLAAAYAESGRFEEAIRTAEQARALAESLGQKDVARRNAELKELYRSGQAYHEP